MEEQVKEEEQDDYLITDEMRATVTDHVIVHGMSMTETGKKSLSKPE